MRYLFSLIVFALCGSSAFATDWLTHPSTYTHSPETGQRVAQYQPTPAPSAPTAPNFRSSGYTHTRSSLNYGASADNYHRVEKWGDEVRPYGEWRFPYRPYSTPYPNWGPPYAGFNLGLGFPGYGNPGPIRGRDRYRPELPPGDSGGDGGGRRPRRYNPPSERGYLGDGTWPLERRDFNGNLPPASPFNPYPAGPGTPYPVSPYYDGYYGDYR